MTDAKDDSGTPRNKDLGIAEKVGPKTGPSDGADPWCTWCDEDLPETVWMLHDEDDGRWPPAFCSEECAEAWGNWTHEGTAYTVERGDVCAFEP